MTKKFTHNLLVYTPLNTKKGFYKTVILIIAEKRSGTYGLCINRKVTEIPCTCGECRKPPAPLFIGGPEALDDRYFFLHDQTKLAEPKDKLFDGVYLSCPHAVEDFVEGQGCGKMITGYSRWKPGQLQQEINDGWWLVDPNPDPSVFLKHAAKKLWRDLSPRHHSLMFGSEN